MTREKLILRDRALLAVCDHLDAACLELGIVPWLRATDVVQDDESGKLKIRWRNVRLELSEPAMSALLDYLEAFRLWGAPLPLFSARDGRSMIPMRTVRYVRQSKPALLRNRFAS